MMPIKKRVQYLAEYIGLRLISAILGILPITIVHGITNLLALFAFHILRIRRQVAIKNISVAFGETLSKNALEKICRASYIHIGQTFIEMLLVHKLKNKIAGMVNPGDLETIKRKINKGRGVILITGHLGNWELTGASLAAAGIPTITVGARQSNPYVDAFIYQSRTALGFKVVQPDTSVKHLVKALKNHNVVGLVSDQNAGDTGVFVNFFGQLASTPRGGAQLALKYKTPLMVMVTIRTAPGHYKNIIREVEILPDDTIESLTQRYTTMLENIVRQYPEQYFWMHRRWKTRPPTTLGAVKK